MTPPLSIRPGSTSSALASVERDLLTAAIASLETDTLVVITDETVWNLHGRHLKIPSTRKRILWISPPGEAGKSYENYRACAEHILSAGIHRKAHILAFGGGAVTDFAGFVAATLLRGLPWSAVPTTLLAMVDASIGGKTGINSEHGKNLVGAFHFPKNVWIDSRYLKTLSRDQVLSGRGEILKYCLLDERIYDKVAAGDPLETVIAACAAYKQRIVKRDPYEAGARKLLNLGHTYGHALEKSFGLPHGIAVAAGIRLIIEHSRGTATLLAEYHDLLDVLELESALDLFATPFPASQAERILSFIGKDKKLSSAEDIDLVLVKKVGKPQIRSTPIRELRDVVSRFSARGRGSRA
jgi:3-dehydroquinate synthase